MKSVLNWIGGKSLLAKDVVARIPEHQCYVEPFAGAGWVFFRKEPSPVEVLNDLNSDLVAFYRVIQHHLEEFLKQFKWCLTAREWWDDWTRQLTAGGLTDIQRAARFYYIQRMSFGGKVNGRSYGYSTTHPSRINLLRMEEDLSAAHLRLHRVQVENLAYPEAIRRYDREHTFFYIDPPYFGCEGYYGKGLFSRDEFSGLAEQLAGIKGKFLLSLNDVPEIREIFKPFEIEPITTRYSCTKDAPRLAKEVFIKNF
ncbi:MAG: DNA adenine methylase [Desulfovibrionaceae bacterium]|nr:DNA adenine methylase [Desulfovibrionaceae bacterium]